MTRLEKIPHRAMDLASNAVGSLRQHMPSRAGTLLQTGMTLGALKTGARVAGKFARRNPAILAATVAGAGILWYAAHRKARQAEKNDIQGQSRRVDARQPTSGSAAGQAETSYTPGAN